MMKFPRRILAVVPLVVLLGIVSVVRADTTLPADLPSMTSRAELIFSGTCNKAVQEVKSGFDVTTFTFTVKEVMKGNVTVGQSFSFSKWFGRGGSPYEIGKDYVLFLLPEAKSGLRATVGNYYGSFKVTRSADGKATVMNARGNRNLFPAAATKSATVTKAMSVGGVTSGKTAGDAPVGYKAFVDMVNVLKGAKE